MKLRAISLAIALFAFVNVKVVSANDDCSDYFDLTGMPLPLTVTGTTLGLTNDYGPFPDSPECWQGEDWHPSCASGNDATYKWTAPADGEYTFSLCGSLAGHQHLLLYQFTCPDEPVYPDDFVCGSYKGCESDAILQDILLSADQEVLIVVDRNGVGGGPFELRIDDTTELESHLEALMDIFHIPGASACIVHGGEIAWDGHFGMADIEAGRAVTDSTLFLVASVSKPVTGAALMQLYEDGYFELDDNINDYLSFEVVHPWYPETPMTFRMLMSHVAGIDDNWSVLLAVEVDDMDSPISLGQFLEDYLTPGGLYYNPQANFRGSAPGSEYHYTNVGAALAGYLAEHIAGSPTLEAYCQENLFEPLGMNESSYFLSGVNINNLVVPYSYTGGDFHPHPHIGSPWYPAYLLRTSALELARFLIAMMQGGEIDGTRILESETVDLIHSLHYPELVDWYGLFWVGENANDLWWWGHNGDYTGASSTMWFTPDGDVGMICLFNRRSDTVGPFVEVVWEHMLGTVTAVPDPAGETVALHKPILLQNYPNPFNPQTTITFRLAQPQHAEIAVYDLAGKLLGVLADRSYDVGSYSVVWNGKDSTGRAVSSGTYVVRLSTETAVEARKVMLLR
jgi:CubicO group peptidase (beta-lactamase class C family)